MRIMHLLLSSGFAGTERATAEMCNAHAAAHEVLLVIKRSHRARGISIRDFLQPGVTVVEVGNLWPRRAIGRAIETFRPDVVHAHLRRATRLLARLNPPCATISTLHMWVNGPHFLQMDGLIVIAGWQKRDLVAYRGRVFDINESLLPHRRLAPPEIAKLRLELGAAPGEFLVGGVGRLARSKGFDLLIAAYLRAGVADMRLVLIGDGRERGRLERLAAKRVRFTGFRKDVKDCYQALDLFVTPSRSEPLGRVVLEALDAGTPVLATQCEGPKEILARFPGRLVPLEDVGALSEALVQSRASPPARERPDLSAYYIESVAAETLAAYEQLVADRLAGRAPRGAAART